MSTSVSGISQQKEQLLAWWQHRNGRERLMIVLVGLCALLALADALIWQPMQRERKQLLGRIDAAEQTTAKVAARVAQQNESPQTLAARASKAQDEIARIDAQIEAMRQRVVTPSKMADRMREFVASARGLTVLSFKNLAPQAVGNTRDAGATTNAGRPADAPPASMASDGSRSAGAAAAAGHARGSVAGLFRHPLEVRVTGGYADIAQWIAFVETESDGFYLSSLQFELNAQGRIEARVELFTLGTEATWLTL